MNENMILARGVRNSSYRWFGSVRMVFSVHAFVSVYRMLHEYTFVRVIKHVHQTYILLGYQWHQLRDNTLAVGSN